MKAGNTHAASTVSVRGYGCIIAAMMQLFWAAAPALSQQVYRSVDASGQVTYSDTLPNGALKVKRLGESDTRAQPSLPSLPSGESSPPGAQTPRAASAAATEVALPAALQLVASRYPVVLTTGKNCANCAQGRALLLARGVPFSETVLATADDLELLQNLTGKIALPMLSIGSLNVKSYSPSDWIAFLDAAGYPKTSVLPPNYRNPPPINWQAPRTARTEPATPEPARSAAPAEPAEPAPRLVPLPPSDNPLGLKF
jgi:hypothetical protein